MQSGAGESGKSTVLKQMRLIHASGFDNGERESFRLIVFDNTIAIVNLLFEAAEQLQIPFEHTEYYVSWNCQHDNGSSSCCLEILRLVPTGRAITQIRALSIQIP